MNEAEKQKIIGELEDFYKELKSYKRLLNLKGRLSDKDTLRETLVRKAGALKPKIIELTGKEYISRFSIAYNIWDVGFTAHRISDICDVALDYCIDAINEAIGKLESDIKKGRRDKAVDVIEKPIKKQSLGKEISKHLQGTPEEIAPHIVGVAQGFQFPQGFNCYAEEEPYESSRFYKKFTIYRITDSFTPGVTWMHAGPEDEPQAIGSITLRPLPNNKTLLIAKHTLPSFDSEGSYFDSFLKRLSEELKSLEFEKSVHSKVWQWLKSHKILGIIVTVIIVVVTLLGTNWTIVEKNFTRFLEFFR